MYLILKQEREVVQQKWTGDTYIANTWYSIHAITFTEKSARRIVEKYDGFNSQLAIIKVPAAAIDMDEHKKILEHLADVGRGSESTAEKIKKEVDNVLYFADIGKENAEMFSKPRKPDISVSKNDIAEVVKEVLRDDRKLGI